MRYDAMEEDYEEITVFDKPALFSGERIDRDTVPRGYFKYEMRHDDDFQGYAVEIANSVIVNLWGTVIMRDEIRLPRNGRLDICADNLNYGTGDCRSMADFMEKYPARIKPPIEYER